MTARSALLVYAAAFGLMVAAATVLAVATIGSLNSIRMLWLSVALSAGAIISALGAVIVPRR